MFIKKILTYSDMRKKNNLKAVLFFLILSLFFRFSFLFADEKTDSKKILVPRVALISPDTPVSGEKQNRMMVYNTSTSGKYSSPGYYIWDGKDWKEITVIDKNTLKWNTVTDSFFRAMPNHGYIINNPGTVKITLPPSPEIGDIIRITSINQGGWELEQNPGQYIQLDNLKKLMFERKKLPFDDDNYMLVMSYDASVIAVPNENSIWTSNDMGDSWTKHKVIDDKNIGFSELQISSDGRVMTATGEDISDFIVFSDFIIISNDSGVTWKKHTFFDDNENGNIENLLISSDGRIMAVFGCSKITEQNGKTYQKNTIFTSTDSGTIWTEYTISDDKNMNSESLKISSDGRIMAIAGSRGITNPDKNYFKNIVLTSTDSGTTWTEHAISDDENMNFKSLKISFDGRIMAIASKDLNIWISKNFGATWSKHTISDDENISTFCNLQISPDGSKMAIDSTNPFDIWISKDSGTTWKPLGISYLGKKGAYIFDNTFTKLVCKIYDKDTLYYSGDCGRNFVEIPNSDKLKYTFSGDSSTIIQVDSPYFYIYNNNTKSKGKKNLYLTGYRNASIELQYIGDGKFIPISFAGKINIQTK